MAISERRKQAERELRGTIADVFALTGAERILVNNIFKDLRATPQGLDTTDIGFRLAEIGVSSAAKDNKNAALDYAHQLQWEGDSFGQPGKIKAGKALERRILWGKRDNTGD
jgi:hypothetical protein